MCKIQFDRLYFTRFFWVSYKVIKFALNIWKGYNKQSFSITKKAFKIYCTFMHETAKLPLTHPYKLNKNISSTHFYQMFTFKRLLT